MVIEGERERQVKAARWKGKRAPAAHNNLILLRNVFFLHVTFLRPHNIHTGEQQMAAFGRREQEVRARGKRGEEITHLPRNADVGVFPCGGDSSSL